MVELSGFSKMNCPKLFAWVSSRVHLLMYTRTGAGSSKNDLAIETSWEGAVMNF